MPTNPTIPLASLDLKDRAQRSLQVRERESTEAIARYAEIYQAQGAEALPPIRVVRVAGGTHYVVDGFHRVRAALKAGLAELPAKISDGSVRDAMLASLGANGEHGLPLTLAERIEAATALLEDTEWRTWSDARIAKHVHVSPQLVAKLRKKIPGAQVEERKTASGRTQKAVNSRALAATKAAGTQPIDLRVKAAQVDQVEALGQSLTGAFAGMPPIKTRILAALWLAGQVLDHTTLRALIDGIPDVHPGQLRRSGLVQGSSQDGWALTEEGVRVLQGHRWLTDQGRPYTLTEPGILGQAEERAPAPAAPPAPAKAEPPELSLDEDAEKAPSAAPAPAPAAATDPATGLRLALATRLWNGMPAWRGTDSERIALVALVLTDCARGEKWGRDLVQRAEILLHEHLIENLVDELRMGSDRLVGYPSTGDLARLFGIDPDTLRIEAGVAP